MINLYIFSLQKCSQKIPEVLLGAILFFCHKCAVTFETRQKLRIYIFNKLYLTQIADRRNPRTL